MNGSEELEGVRMKDSIIVIDIPFYCDARHLLRPRCAPPLVIILDLSNIEGEHELATVVPVPNRRGVES